MSSSSTRTPTYSKQQKIGHQMPMFILSYLTNITDYQICPSIGKFFSLSACSDMAILKSPCYFHVSEVIHQLVKIWHLHGGLKDTVDHCCNNGHGPQAAGPQEVHRVHGCCHYRAARHGLCCQASADVYPAQHLTENADCISTIPQCLPKQSRLLITGRKQSMRVMKACYMKFERHWRTSKRFMDCRPGRRSRCPECPLPQAAQSGASQHAWPPLRLSPPLAPDPPATPALPDRLPSPAAIKQHILSQQPMLHQADI